VKETIQVLVTLEVNGDPTAQLDRYDLRDAAVEAVERAVSTADAAGFQHTQRDKVWVRLLNTELHPA
jgi:hypothetical protein